MSEKRKAGGAVLSSHDASTSSDHRPTEHSEDVFVFPPSFAQQRLWFLDQLDPGNPSYNIPDAFRLTGRLNVAALEKSLNETIRRHEVLRTTFSVVDGEPVQVIAPAMTLRLTGVDLRELPETAREAEVKQVVAGEVQGPFDLSRGPLMRAHLLRLAEEQYILLLTIHHIVSDGWSMEIFYQELSTFYEAFATGKPSPLPELPVQYADFVVWQREWLQEETLEAQLAYWRGQLADAPRALELSTDHHRPATWTHRGARQSLLLPKNVTEALKEFSRMESVTLFMTLLAGFAVLLHRYTGQDDIVIGTPIANRNRPEIEGLIGFFVNTLVIHTDLSGNPGFRELLSRVRDVCLGAYDHQDLPFEKLVEELQPERNMNQSPLFQVMFDYQNNPRQLPTFSGLDVSLLEVDSGTAKFDLSLSIEQDGEELLGTVEYNTDLFNKDTITRMLGHYQTLLEGIADDSDHPIGMLPLLTDAERHQLLVEWNDTRAEYPEDSCLHHLFEAQVERTPEAVAVICKDKQLTYRQLNRRANQLAHHLRGLGVGPETPVGICVERSLEMAVGLLGILKAGGAYVPQDPSYPKDRLAFMLEDARVAVLLSQKHLLEHLPTQQAKVVCLDSDWEFIAQESEENPTSGVTSENLVYIIYTSGSTGRPKGVLITHRALVNQCLAAITCYDLQPDDRRLQNASISFDVTPVELFPCWLLGATVMLWPDQMLPSPAVLLRFLEKEKLTVISLPASYWHELVSALSSSEASLPSTLRVLVTGIEQVSPDRFETWRELIGDRVHWFNAYGPTETTINATAYKLILSRDNQKIRTVPIGRPFANTQIYILDRYLQPVPTGVPGELHIGGVGLARGYLNLPDLTAHKFIPNPFSEEPGARLFKTGDQGRYLPDGNIEFLGRTDHQVKIRGFRIELGEIESTLTRQPEVRQTVVTARELESGDKQLVAYVVPEQGSAPTVSQLRSMVQEKLPGYMVPSTFMLLESLPLLSNGKVDRQALPAPDQTRSQLEERYVAPRDALELQLVKIWEQVLGVQPIGVQDNFFALGGHSLLAVRLFSAIEKVFQKSLPLSALFQGSTVEALVNCIRREDWSHQWSCLVPVQPGGTRNPFFCVAPAADEAIGFGSLAHRLGPNQPFYGLKLLGLDSPGTAPHVEDMAAQCIQEIETLQPESPYLLGGACMGGLVAFEMACQLHHKGKEVALLVLLDSSQPPPLITLREYIPRLLFHHLPRGHMFYCLMRDLREKTRKYKRKLSWSQEGRRHYSVWKAHEQARRTYQPRPYQGHITLFQSQEFHIRFPDHESRWSALAEGGVDCHILPCSHQNTLSEPNVRIVAEKLNACFAGVQEK